MSLIIPNELITLIKERPRKKKMSISGVGATNHVFTNVAVEGGKEAAASQNDNIESSKQDTGQRTNKETQDGEIYDSHPYNTGYSHQLSTQDFMVLKVGATEDSLEILDEVISKMKENMDEIGDAVEVISEMVKKTSKENVALQLLQKTMEAMEKTDPDKSDTANGPTGGFSCIA